MPKKTNNTVLVTEEPRPVISEEDTLAEIGEKVLRGLMAAENVAGDRPAKREVVAGLASKWSILYGQLTGLAVALAHIALMNDEAIEKILEAGELPTKQVKMGHFFQSKFEGSA